MPPVLQLQLSSLQVDLREIFVRSFKIFSKWSVRASKQASIDTHACEQCSHASVGLAQGRPKYMYWYKYCMLDLCLRFADLHSQSPANCVVNLGFSHQLNCYDLLAAPVDNTLLQNSSSQWYGKFSRNWSRTIL